MHRAVLTHLVPALLVLALVVGAFTTVVTAEEDDALTFRSFDVSGIVARHEPRRGPPLGALSLHDRREARRDARSPEDPVFMAETLVDLVRSQVRPEAWEQAGVWVVFRRGYVLVRQRPDVVREVEAFLYRLAAAATRRVLLTVEVLGGAVGEEQRESGGRKLSGSLELPFGARRSLAVTNRIDYVHEYEVEIAQGSTIADPQYDALDEGLVIDAVAYPLLDGKRVALEAYVQFCDLVEMRRVELGIDEEYFAQPFRSQKRFPTGTLELPSCRHADAHVTTIVPSGGDVRLPIVARGRKFDVRFRVEILGEAGADAILDVSALTTPSFPLYAGEPVEPLTEPAYARPLRIRWVENVDDAPLGTVDELVDRLQEGVEPARWEGGAERERLNALGNRRLLVSARPDLLAAVRRFLAAREAEALRPVVLDVAVHSVRGAVTPGPGREIDPEVSTLVTSGRLHTVPGRWASLRVGTTLNYLADYDVEVAQEARIPDPVTGQSFGGLVANLRPHLPLGNRTVLVDLDLLFADHELAAEPFDTGAQCTGPIEQVRARRTRLDTTVGVPLGGTTLLDAGPDPSNPGARLVVAISVSTP